jgi:putative SOS response-associated peptidase YedK
MPRRLSVVPLLRVIRAADGAKELAEARWGLIPYWANGEPPKDCGGRPLTTFNAKIETLRTAAAYRNALVARAAVLGARTRVLRVAGTTARLATHSSSLHHRQ